MLGKTRVRHAAARRSSPFIMALAMLLAACAAGGPGGDRALASPGAGWEERGPAGAIDFFGVAAGDASTAWAVGRDAAGNGVIYRTGDGGLAWTLQSTLPAEPLGVICSLDADTAWAYGYDMTTRMNTYIYRTGNGGDAWNKVYSSTGRFVLDVSPLSGSEVWMLGVELSPGNPPAADGYVARSGDRGATWTRLYTHRY